MKNVTPYKDSEDSKKEQVAGMFNSIAGKYDFLNHFLSLNIDKIWRRKVIRIVAEKKPKYILDVATGTGDLAIASLKCNPEKVEGIDISDGMLEVGQKKLVNRCLSNLITLHRGDAENIPFAENTFDANMVAFGVRNFENLECGLTEMYRVLKEGGRTVILEFTLPTAFPVKQLYNFYFSKLLPGIGGLFSKDKLAYTYLPDSVKAFAQREQLIDLMKKAGYTKTYYKTLALGIAAIYVGDK